MSSAATDTTYPLFAISEDHEALREAVRAVAEDKIAPVRRGGRRGGALPQEAHDALVATDFFAPHVPEEYGGVGADALATCIVIEEVARVCASCLAHPGRQQARHDAAPPRRQRGGQEASTFRRSPQGVDVLLRPSEREAGSDTAAMRCRAGATATTGSSTGQKSWITNAGVSDFYTVMAVTDPDGRAGATSLPSSSRSPTRASPSGRRSASSASRAVPPASCYFDHCASPATGSIGAEGEGLKIALRTLDHTRVTIGAQAVGIAQGALDFALGYVKERKQFGKRIADFQGIQFMLADMAMQLEAARQLVYVAAAKSERDDADLTFFGAAAKCYASDVAMQVTTDAVQLLGGAGYTRDFPVERMMRDAKITQIYEGTNQVQRVVMARQLLAGIQSDR